MKKILFSFFLLLVILTAGAAWWLQEDMHRQLNQAMAIEQDQVLLVKPGQSLKSLARQLVDKNWISQPYYLVLESRRRQVSALIKAGEYTIKPGTSQLQLLDILVAGKVKQYSMTLPEGWTFRQIIDAIAANSQLVKTLHSYEPKQVMAAAGFSGYFAEGRIFPDTYLFPAGTSDIDFIWRAINTQEQVLNEEWALRDEGLPYDSAYQALIMASIIEKETGLAEERRKIAGVFVRRLQRGMKLQTDPTVIYAMAERFDGNIRRKDLSLDSPYNTYRYRGLPPTPIASPGRLAIQAALHPLPGKELYFVAKGDGSHHFSATLKEHNNAVARYQLKKKR